MQHNRNIKLNMYFLILLILIVIYMFDKEMIIFIIKKIIKMTKYVIPLFICDIKKKEINL